MIGPSALAGAAPAAPRSRDGPPPPPPPPAAAAAAPAGPAENEQSPFFGGAAVQQQPFASPGPAGQEQLELAAANGAALHELQEASAHARAELALSCPAARPLLTAAACCAPPAPQRRSPLAARCAAALRPSHLLLRFSRFFVEAGTRPYPKLSCEQLADLLEGAYLATGAGERRSRAGAAAAAGPRAAAALPAPCPALTSALTTSPGRCRPPRLQPPRRSWTATGRCRPRRRARRTWARGARCCSTRCCCWTRAGRTSTKVGARAAWGPRRQRRRCPGQLTARASCTCCPHRGLTTSLPPPCTRARAVSHLFGALNFYCKLFHRGRYGLKAATPPDALALLEQRRDSLLVLYDAGGSRGARPGLLPRRGLPARPCGCASSRARPPAASSPAQVPHCQRSAERGPPRSGCRCRRSGPALGHRGAQAARRRLRQRLHPVGLLLRVAAPAAAHLDERVLQHHATGGLAAWLAGRAGRAGCCPGLALAASGGRGRSVRAQRRRAPLAAAGVRRRCRPPARCCRRYRSISSAPWTLSTASAPGGGAPSSAAAASQAATAARRSAR
jgi:hypothetical protein